MISYHPLVLSVTQMVTEKFLFSFPGKALSGPLLSRGRENKQQAPLFMHSRGSGRGAGPLWVRVGVCPGLRRTQGVLGCAHPFGGAECRGLV